MDAGQIIFYGVLFYLPRIKCVKLGVCSKEKSVIVSGQNVVRTYFFCCRHYEESSGVCEECDTGYESNGTRCEPCKTEKTAKDSANANEGFLNKESGIYFGSSGLLAFVICILMAYICYKKGKRKAGSNMSKQTPDELAMEAKFQVHGTKGEMNTNENDYDEIELYLSDIKLAVNQEKNIKEKDKFKQGGNKHSKKEKGNNDSSINPYQRVVSSAVDVHEYSSTEKGDNSKDNYRDSGYLHPYQPLLLDTKNLKHDYTECKDLDIVESKATPDTKNLKHDYTECKDLDIVESKATPDTKNLKHDYTECKNLDIVESKATPDTKNLKHDYTECRDLDVVEAPTSNIKEDVVDKDEVKAEDTNSCSL